MTYITNCLTTARFGNVMMQYCYARKVCEQQGRELRCGDWIGRELFQLDDPFITDRYEQRGELDIHREGHCDFFGYAQLSSCMTYTKQDLKRWFRWKPEVEGHLQQLSIPSVAAHRRLGDYVGLGRPIVSEASYYEACKEYNLEEPTFITEENPTLLEPLPEFLPDFYRMLKAPVLLRGNSTFSWMAGAMSEGQVYSPIIAQCGGGENDVSFVRGNWPQLATYPFTQDLWMPEQDMPMSYSEELRYNYPLTTESLVVDVGFFKGEFSETIAKRFGCTIHAYEPFSCFYEGNTDIPGLIFHPFGVSAERCSVKMGVKGGMSGVYHAEDTSYVRCIGIEEVIPLNRRIDLIKINIEGGEYELLEAMIAKGLHKQCDNIQVQFHPLKPEHKNRRDNIKRKLLETHLLTYEFEWCWENYKLR